MRVREGREGVGGYWGLGDEEHSREDGGKRIEIEEKNEERMDSKEHKEGGGENERNKERNGVRALILKCWELTEASPGERQMNDVFLSQRYVDKHSPAHPVSTPAFSFILFLFPHFLPLFLFFVSDREYLLQRRLCALIMKTEQFLYLYLTPTVPYLFFDKNYLGVMNAHIISFEGLAHQIHPPKTTLLSSIVNYIPLCGFQICNIYLI